ncbi:hypothetical protein NIES4071_50630 [Calothrix sp. NIES-4071]|nr:hypothetical protein NIES4071_50630 [Calothrix sp. NIES-4071]BAZ59371.1 hypothetical protein NIES4105_50580 [Calothrix sp. NIES-4105]
MQRNLFILGLAALTSTACFAVSLTAVSQNTPASVSNKVTFFCQKGLDKASGKNIPFTVAWVPERNRHVRIIGWKSEFFEKAGWTPQERCEKVTERFNKIYDAGRLNYFGSGTNNGYPIICGLLNKDDACNPENQLFTVKSGSQIKVVLEQLLEIAEGKASNVIYQNSGQQIRVSVKDILNNATVAD